MTEQTKKLIIELMNSIESNHESGDFGKALTYEMEIVDKLKKEMELESRLELELEK